MYRGIPDATDPVEEELAGRGQPVQHLRHPPWPVRVHLPHQILLPLDVVPIEVQPSGREHEQIGRIGSTDRRQPPRLVEPEPDAAAGRRGGLAAGLDTGGGAGHRVVVAEVPDVLLLRAEDQTPDPGVDAIGADDQVVPTTAAATELHVDAVGAFDQRHDPVPEPVVGHVPGPLVPQTSEVAAEHLEVAADEFGRNHRPQPAGGVHHVLVGRRRPDPFDVVPTSHPVQHRSLTPAGRLDTLALVSFHVRGIVAQESTPHPELTIGTLLLDALGRRADEYPLTAGAFAGATAGRATDNAYEFGIERILDGLERFAG